MQVKGFHSKSAKTLALGEHGCIEKTKQIPWQQVEQEYSTNFSKNDTGNPAKSARIALGSLVSISVIEGFSFVDRISWDNYNESGDLIEQIEKYHERFGFYPESVHADKIYRNRQNRQYCKKYGIRLSGPPLGRPKKVTPENAEQLKQEKQQHRQDEIDRIAVEGKFGQGKRRFSLSRIMAKLAGTSRSACKSASCVHAA